MTISRVRDTGFNRITISSGVCSQSFWYVGAPQKWGDFTLHILKKSDSITESPFISCVGVCFVKTDNGNHYWKLVFVSILIQLFQSY